MGIFTRLFDVTILSVRCVVSWRLATEEEADSVSLNYHSEHTTISGSCVHCEAQLDCEMIQCQSAIDYIVSLTISIERPKDIVAGGICDGCVRPCRSEAPIWGSGIRWLFEPTCDCVAYCQLALVRCCSTWRRKECDIITASAVIVCTGVAERSFTWVATVRWAVEGNG